MPKLRILIADDHEAVRIGVRTIVDAEDDMAVVGEAADGEDALEQAHALSPDVVIMDISMPRMNGLEATTRMLARFPAVKVVVFTRHAEDGFLRQLLHAGASGYVLKHSRSVELIGAIRSVAAGHTYVDSTLARHVGSGRPVRSGADLTEREEEVLRLVAWAHPNTVIAERLQLSVKTVETHKSKAMRKLDLRTRTDLLRLALLKGWLTEP